MYDSEMFFDFRCPYTYGFLPLLLNMQIRIWTLRDCVPFSCICPCPQDIVCLFCLVRCFCPCTGVYSNVHSWIINNCILFLWFIVFGVLCSCLSGDNFCFPGAGPLDATTLNLQDPDVHESDNLNVSPAMAPPTSCSSDPITG